MLASRALWISRKQIAQPWLTSRRTDLVGCPVQAGATVIVAAVDVRLPPQGQVVQESRLPVLGGHVRGGVSVQQNYGLAICLATSICLCTSENLDRRCCIVEPAIADMVH